MSKPESSRVTWARKLRVITENRARRAERWKITLWGVAAVGAGVITAFIAEVIKWVKGN